MCVCVCIFFFICLKSFEFCYSVNCFPKESFNCSDSSNDGFDFNCSIFLMFFVLEFNSSSKCHKFT